MGDAKANPSYGSILWRMPSRRHPSLPRYYNHRAVHLQCQHRRSPYGSFSLYSRTILTPGKMIGPALLTRMEQRHQFASQRVDRLRDSRFKLVARTTSQTHILKRGCSTPHLRQNVIHRQGNTAIHSLSQAIATPIAIRLLNLAPQVNRNITRHNSLG